MSFPRYQAYKDSGVEWLGEVPAHWAVSKIGFESTVKARLGWKGLKAEEYIDAGHVFLSTPNIKGVKINFEDVNYITDERYFESPEIMLQVGDVLVVKDGATLGIVNVVRELPGTATVNSSIAVIRPGNAIDSVYLHYFLSSNYIQHVIQRMKDGMGVPHLFQDDLRKFSVILPLLDEQRAIAAFLDAETARIDALVARQEALIATLQEKRRALISHAVTRGLDPAAPMRDSGVPWLGAVPAHWDVKRLKFIAEVRTGVAKGRELGNQEIVEVPYLRVANVQDGYLDLSDVATIPFARSEVDRYLLCHSDLLMNEGGDFDKLGRGYVWQSEIEPCSHQNHVFAVRLHHPEDAFWVNLATQTSYAKQYFISRSKQSTNLASISSSNIQEWPVVMPPQVERQAIRRHIEAETAQIDTLIARARAFIEVLREHRGALIAAAVTGQIDVRGYTIEATP